MFNPLTLVALGVIIFFVGAILSLILIGRSK